jgi:D-alanine-D-alanine ligase
MTSPVAGRRVAIIHNADFLDAGGGQRALSYEADAAVLDNVKAVRAALEAGGATVTVHAVVDALDGVIERLREEEAEVVFNLVETLGGDPTREHELPALLSRARIPFTGSPASALRTACAKDRARRALERHGVPIAPGFTAASAAAARKQSKAARFPLFVKPARTDASIGIDQSSVVSDADALVARIEALVAAGHRAPFLVEEYLPGTEINVAILGGDEAFVTQIDFSAVPAGYRPIVTYDCKWREESPEYAARSVAATPGPVTEEASRIARRAFAALGLCGYGRIDQRQADDGSLHVIDVNPNPDIHPDAGFSIAARTKGLDHQAVVMRIVGSALARSHAA